MQMRMAAIQIFFSYKRNVNVARLYELIAFHK